jgi:D-cysteine desulfhydrase
VESIVAHTPALFRTFPQLAARLPRRPYVTGPTPVEPLRLAGVAAGRLLVKRDEACCPLYGGNKARKLELIIGHARARGSRRLVTTGGLGTNHGLATAILGREAGLETTLVLVDQPVTDTVRETLSLAGAYGARLVHAGGVAGAATAVVRALAAAWRAGERPYLVATGGTSLRGTAAMVSAGLELGEQVRAGELPVPSRIVVPLGTGGTMVGLVVGLRLAGLPTVVEGILVTDIMPRSPRWLLRHARATLRFLARLDPGVPDLWLSEADFPIDRTQVGAGYGAVTAASLDAVRAAGDVGVHLETTYTGKCLAAVVTRLRAGTLGRGPVVFWNTHSDVDLHARAPREATVEALPAGLRAVLARG